MKKNLGRLLIGFVWVALMVAHSSALLRIPFVTVLDNYLYDSHIRLSALPDIDDRVVIIDIDEQSLAEQGRWPWGRQKISKLVQKLADDYGAAAIGFDVVFAEPDESSGLPALETLGKTTLRQDAGFHQQLQKLRKTLDHDAEFAQTLIGRPVVLGYYFTGLGDPHKSGSLPPSVFPADFFNMGDVVSFPRDGYGANLEILQKNARSGGHFVPVVDNDGISRRVDLLIEYNHEYYEAFSLALLRVALGNPDLIPAIDGHGGGVEKLQIRLGQESLEIPVDQNISALIPYRGPEKSFPYIPATDVMEGRIQGNPFEGRIVLVGTSAPGLKDLRATPVGKAYPGVEVHANMISGILDGRIKQPPAYSQLGNTLTVFFLGIALAFLLPKLPPLRGTLLILSVLASSLAVHYWLWENTNLALPLAPLLLTIGFLYVLNMAWGFFAESRIKHQMTSLFGQYVPPELVQEMAKDPTQYNMSGRNEELTVLFSDVRDFTHISEGLPPDELVRLMNFYLGEMTQIIQSHHGTLDKYIGDAIMAFWGAPISTPDHAALAVRAALAMQARMRSMSDYCAEQGWPTLRIGIGLNTGTMTVGDMGSTVRKAYTVMGDAVNLGSRLESITKTYGCSILISEETRRKIPNIICREVDRVIVKGKNEAVAIFEPLGENDDLSEAQQAELTIWHDALKAFRAQNWDQAEQMLATLVQQNSECRLYPLYLDRIGDLRHETLGPAWDGTVRLTSK